MSRNSNQARVKDDAVSAGLYTKRNQKKHDGEMQMLAKAVSSLPDSAVSTFLDAPCGVGRATVWLSRRGFQLTAIDLGKAAVKLTQNFLVQENIEAEVENQNIFEMGFADAQFDATLCFRLIHHFEDKSDRDALISELCRVSGKYVLISYISPYSVTSMRRKLRYIFTRKPVKQNPTPLQELAVQFEKCGFRLHYQVPRSKFLHSLQLCVFERVE